MGEIDERERRKRHVGHVEMEGLKVNFCAIVVKRVRSKTQFELCLSCK